MKTAFVVTTRMGSKRIPGKPLIKLNGIPVLGHLLNRLKQIDLPIHLAAPYSDAEIFWPMFNSEEDNIKVHSHHNEDPLARIQFIAQQENLDHVIRITHDKIFIEKELIYKALDVYHRGNYDYLYSSDFTEGSGFEIISAKVLKQACEKFKDIEHITYAIKSVTNNSCNFLVPNEYKSDARLLIDYPKDLQMLETVFSSLGNECNLKDVIRFCDQNSWVKFINKNPVLTLYTCAYNAKKFINKAMESVASQLMFKQMEYLLIDDFSDDETFKEMNFMAAARHGSGFPNIKCYRNSENKGLASSSNFALSRAKGKYIMRLDADDFFTSPYVCSELVNEMNSRPELDVIYPNYYNGTYDLIGNGKESHHPAGAIFKTKALNAIRFTEELRHYDGLDLYQRAKNQLKIGYLNKPTFFYTQRPDSLSKTDPELREQIKEKICQTR